MTGVQTCALPILSENGYGKRTPIKEYTLQKRGGKGVITYKISEKTGLLIGARSVEDEDELMLINDSGIAIRINVSDISVTSRNAMGVTLMRTVEEEKVVTMAKVNITEEEIEEGSKDSQQIAQDELQENNSEINPQVNEEINE